jgi:hypothetical protein
MEFEEEEDEEKTKDTYQDLQVADFSHEDARAVSLKQSGRRNSQTRDLYDPELIDELEEIF